MLWKHQKTAKHEVMKSQNGLTTLPPGFTNNQNQPFQDDPAIAGFLAAREALQRRKLDMETELAHIQKLLDGQNITVKTVPPSTESMATPPVVLRAAQGSNRGLGQMVVNLLRDGPLTKDQIVERLQAQKFEFFGKPKPALDAVLYTKKFRRQGKLFELAIT